MVIKKRRNTEHRYVEIRKTHVCLYPKDLYHSEFYWVKKKAAPNGTAFKYIST